MMLLVCFLLLLLTILLACLATIQVPRSRLSAYELKRLVAREDARAIRQHAFEIHHSELTSLVRILQFTVMITITIVAVLSFGLWLGLFISVLIVIIHGQIARLSFIRKVSNRMFNGLAGGVMSYSDAHGWVSLLLRGPKADSASKHEAHSRDELVHLIDSTHVLSHSDKQFLLHALEFDAQTVDERMVLKDDIEAIDKSEVLGPLMLDDLHKTGHHIFPVIDGTLNTIIGLLHLKNMLLVDAKAQTLTAEQAMDSNIAYTHQHDSLRQALTIFLEHKTHMLLVIGVTGDVIGLITLDDILSALFGDTQ